MRELDETDMEILRLLVADARRPYSEIAEAVDLSAPAVSDRIERLRELGVIRRFTADIDRSQLREGVPVLIELEVEPGETRPVREAVAGADPVEHVFVTADARVLFHARLPADGVDRWLAETLDFEAIREHRVTLLADVEWAPSLEGATFGLECAECGNTVTSEGVAATIDGEQYRFCCRSCRDRFEDRYAALQEGVDA